jgi:hypothetical protein
MRSCTASDPNDSYNYIGVFSLYVWDMLVLFISKLFVIKVNDII